MDALELFYISINVRERTWQLSTGMCMSFDGVGGDTYSDNESVAGICELDETQRDRLQRLLDELIPSGKPKLGLTHLTKHTIDVQGAKPVKQRYYPVSPKVPEEMYHIMDQLLEEGVIEPSSSPWSSPVFGCTEVKYLGYIVNVNGLQPDPDKIEAIVKYPVPKNLKRLRRFTRMTSWYRRFINNFPKISEPLNQLTQKSRRWKWGEQQQKAMDTLKEKLTTAPILACPDFSLPFSLQTNAFSTGLGAALTQVQNGHERIICYASQNLNKAERNYTVTEWEYLAIVWAIRKYREYLEGYHFRVITDHSSLKWMYRQKNQVGRVVRWAMELAQYDFDIQHRKGSLHHVSDALSCMFEDESEGLTAITETSDA